MSLSRILLIGCLAAGASGLSAQFPGMPRLPGGGDSRSRRQRQQRQDDVAPPEVRVPAGDTKQVSMHFKMPALGQVENFELRTVVGNGRVAKKWISPGSGRILKGQDTQIARQLAEQEVQSASSIARNLAMGPMGWAGAGLPVRVGVSDARAGVGM